MEHKEGYEFYLKRQQVNAEEIQDCRSAESRCRLLEEQFRIERMLEKYRPAD
jgi:hypothetical protein